jgi:hypothetical protein
MLAFDQPESFDPNAARLDDAEQHTPGLQSSTADGQESIHRCHADPVHYLVGVLNREGTLWNNPGAAHEKGTRIPL